MTFGSSFARLVFLRLRSSFNRCRGSIDAINVMRRHLHFVLEYLYIEHVLTCAEYTQLECAVDEFANELVDEDL